MKAKESCKIIRKDILADGIISMYIETSTIADYALPGQFVSLYCKDGSRILPRPISICEINKAEKTLRLVYRVQGQGTKEISGFQAGDSIMAMGPLGNGFPLEKAAGKKVFLMGGGIGVPPMLEVAKQLDADKSIIMGYRNEDTFLEHEFRENGNVYLATEDGSKGVKGNVMDVVRENALTADVIFACGPAPMLRAIKQYALDHHIDCWISMEERMACGIGACLACVCKSKEVDEHTHVHNKRICKDGPVFEASEVEL